VPKNMYTYGKEGSSVPISIFKDQEDPIIGPEHTYPGIYELKAALRHKTIGDLFAMEESETFDSPFQKEQFHDELDRRQEIVFSKMRYAAQRNFRTKYQEDRKAGPGTKATGGGGGAAAKDAGGAASKAADPDKAKKPDAKADAGGGDKKK
jgi:hypothetical protein